MQLLHESQFELLTIYYNTIHTGPSLYTQEDSRKETYFSEILNTLIIKNQSKNDYFFVYFATLYTHPGNERDLNW